MSYPNVYPRHGKFLVKVSVNGAVIYPGTFSSYDEAVAAAKRCEAMRRPFRHWSISYDSESRKYRLCVGPHKARRYLGRFPTYDDALAALSRLQQEQAGQHRR